MKKKSSPIKAPLPGLRSDRETADYFELHSVAEVWDRLPEIKPVKLKAALAKSIRARHTLAKSPVSLRLESEQIAAAKRIEPPGRSAIKPNRGCGSPKEFAATPSARSTYAKGRRDREWLVHPRSRGLLE
ncbi:MAG: hypothetical protein Q8N47_08950 [Bryobacterales bacterium]|nr:hypothetical protein [Bryobacterales bacterium]